MDQQKRLFLALGLSFGLIFAYSLIFPPAGPPKDTSAAAHRASDAGSLSEQAPLAVAPAEVVPSADGGTVAALPPVKTVERNSPTTHRTFTSQGGGLTHAELLGPKMREQTQVSIAQGYQRMFGKAVAQGAPMDMGRGIPGAEVPLAISIEGAQPLPAQTVYSVSENAKDAAEVVFAAKVSGWDVEKRLEWDPESYEHRYTLTLKNTGPQPVNGELGIHYSRFIDHSLEEAPNFFGGVGNQSRATCNVSDSLHHLVKPEGPKEFKGPVRYWGLDQQYFLAALYPLEGAKEGRCVLNVQDAGRTAVTYFPLTVAPGQSVTFRFGLYIGPKDVELLSAVPSVVPAGMNRELAHLEKAVDFGIWAVICKLLLVVLKFFHGVIHNWGIAIILLTVSIKLVLLPLTHKSMVSAEQMKKLQPKMEEIKKKYADDRERQSMETMKLYQQEKVNPLGGCIPLLVQMPVWIALFTTLRNSYELYREPFISPMWMDLTYKDPTYLLPVALGVTMIITQKMQPQMMDAAQAKMMTYIMPVFFTAIMLNYPSGLALYILTNNVLTIVQQKGLKKYLEARGVVAPAGPIEKKRRLT